MRRSRHGLPVTCIFLLALASIQCGQRGGLSERDRSTLAIHVPDQDEVDRHMQGLWQIFAEEILVTYLHPRLLYVAAHRQVKGLQNNRFLADIVEDLWIEEEE